MPVSKVLGQVNPPANSEQALYTCGASQGAVVSSITICNRQLSGTDYFNVTVAVAGAIDNPMQYLYYELPIDGGDTFIATVGLTLANGDVLRVFSTNANMAFQAFGTELP